MMQWISHNAKNTVTLFFFKLDVSPFSITTQKLSYTTQTIFSKSVIHHKLMSQKLSPRITHSKLRHKWKDNRDLNSIIRDNGESHQIIVGRVSRSTFTEQHSSHSLMLSLLACRATLTPRRVSLTLTSRRVIREGERERADSSNASARCKLQLKWSVRPATN